ncbi:MAG TPA: cytidylate kinase family protein, partial [Spirochaetales bacterium]|nr:cytidylate kinase family protein [Spirochaetales bacterium]
MNQAHNAPIIAISGKSGCGNSTVSRLLAERLGRSLINYTLRNMAQDVGMELSQLLQLASSDPSWDRKLDAHQVELARKGPSVIGSRLAVWMLPDAQLSVYLYASPEVRAARIHKREGGSLESVLEQTKRRDEGDHARYLDIYTIDTDSYGFVDLIINTDRLQPDRIVDIIVA